MNGDAGKIATHELAFASMDATPDLESEGSESTAECVCTPDRPGWAIKCGKKPVASRINLASSVALQNFPDLSVKFLQQFAPWIVAHSSNMLGRSNNVCKQYGSKQTIRLLNSLASCEELFHRIENRIAIAQPRHVKCLIKFDQLCAGNVLRQITAMPHFNYGIASSMYH